MSIALHVDASQVRVKHLREFSRAKNFDEIVGWLVAHAGAVEAELDELTLAELMDVQKQFFDQLVAGAVPKAS